MDKIVTPQTETEKQLRALNQTVTAMNEKLILIERHLKKIAESSGQ
jgi:hypothetical protein